MIKEALEYIVGLKTPVITEIDGNTYSDKPLNRISYVPYAKTIGMKTLTSLVEYIKANIDSMSERMIVHVISPTEVHLYSSLDADRKREYLVEVNAELPDFRFGSFIDHENFVIALQSKFAPNEPACFFNFLSFGRHLNFQLIFFLFLSCLQLKEWQRHSQCNCQLFFKNSRNSRNQFFLLYHRTFAAIFFHPAADGPSVRQK